VKLIVNASTDDTDLGAGTSKIQNLLTQGVDGLVVVPLAPTFKPVLERALAKKVPVVCVNSCIDKWDGQTSFIETNNLHAGEIAGEYIQKLTGGAGTVGMLACIPGLQGCDDRINGAKSKLDSGLKVPAPLSVAGCQRDLAVKGTQNLITGNPGLKVLYGTCGQAALAAANVLRGAGKASVPVIGVDGVPQEMQAIISGKLNATVAQFPMRMGKLGVQQAIRALRGQPVTKHIYSGEELVTKDNVQQFIKDNFLPGMVKGT
jgi:simple sugar transport system substrate-binding protein